MTEAEWLQATDPQPMLGFLQGKASERKLRLFAVACCRHIWHLLSDERSRCAVEVAERFADGMATESERKSAQTSGRAAMKALYPAHNDYAALAVVNAASEDASTAIHADAAAFTAATAADDDDPTKDLKWTAERLWQARILRDIIGNPFRPSCLNPGWLTWHSGLLVSMAQKMYDGRDFSDMPVLADALEDAGCQDRDILTHCRAGGEHVRGCWVVDALLGKK